MADGRQYAVYLCPCNPRGESRLLDELEDFRLETHADPSLRCMMHWWGPPERAGTIHSSFCGFMRLSGEEADLLAEGLREGAALVGPWYSADPLLPRLPVVKRPGAAAVCFETGGLEPLADLLVAKLPKYGPAVERRRSAKGVPVPSKSMSVIQGDFGDGSGPRIDDFRPLLARYPLIAEMLASTSPAAASQEWVRQWGRLRWELQLVSTLARWDESAGLLEAARGGPVEPWKTWQVHERVPLSHGSTWRSPGLTGDDLDEQKDDALEQQRSFSGESESTSASSRASLH
mmetsp:Transcript_66177/g.178880  ORF Transcript_66177/g.178880 Transcript_66177/m.178880 type:complete len:289 (+) Transcript_66177:87-953(+)